MRQRRIKLAGPAIYHCISRVVGRDRLLDAEAREVLRKMLWRVADFCGVEVLTYCILSNHFHVLVRVIPPMDDGPDRLTREVILQRYARFYAANVSPNYPNPEVLAAIFGKGGSYAEQWERRLKARMGDVSEFMKTLKQRFTTWFNQSRGRVGTLWTERFKSLLVENSPFVLQTVAAYIDLNPVRAGLVEDPADYRWCSYAEAMGGNRSACEGIAVVVDGVGRTRNEVLASYRMILFGKGAVAPSADAGAVPGKMAEVVLDELGKVKWSELLRRRIRYFSDGLILGTPEFVRSVAVARGLSKKRSSGAPVSILPDSTKSRLSSDQDGDGIFPRGEESAPLVSWRRCRRNTTDSRVPDRTMR